MPAVRRYRLPVAAAVAATMESATATAVESATTAVEPGVAMKAAANVAVALTAIAVAAASIIAVAVVAVPIVAVTPVVRPVPVVEPGAGTDEDAVHEVVRAVETVGRAGVRIIAVVAIGADRGGTNANADTNADLRVGTACGEEQNS